jgi:orotidine-5'-phosphate decarboxylase
MRAAVEGREGTWLQLLGVTVLTSFDEADLRELGYPCDAATLVDLRVRNAVEAGMDGVVCSPLEVKHLRTFIPPQMQVVTPGVRSAGAGYGDQKRVATPEQALRDGSSYLVIGREVVRAADPRAATTSILNDIRASLHS